MAFALLIGLGSCFSSIEKSSQQSREARLQKESEMQNVFQELRPEIEQAFKEDVVYFDYLQEITLTDSGWIVAEFELSNFMVNMIFQNGPSRERATEQVASRLCLLMRNTAYTKLPHEFREEFLYRVTLYAPPPGPGLVAPLGSARFTNRMRFEWLQP